jgi:hypothetical protein
MARRLLPAVLVAVVLVAIGAATAFATAVTGSQNPQLVVKVSIRPAHPHIGQTIVAHLKITNVTGRTLHGEWDTSWSTPTNGLAAALSGPLGPGVWAHDVERVKVTAFTAKGTYTMSAEADDHHGSSHATISVTLR